MNKIIPQQCLSGEFQRKLNFIYKAVENYLYVKVHSNH